MKASCHADKTAAFATCNEVHGKERYAGGASPPDSLTLTHTHTLLLQHGSCNVNIRAAWTEKFISIPVVLCFFHITDDPYNQHSLSWTAALNVWRQDLEVKVAVGAVIQTAHFQT